MFKIALDAGHGMYTQGKRCLKAIDPNETREWWLNNRICKKIQEKLSNYEGYSLLRVDDPTGKNDVPLITRTNNANKWGADIYLSVHHNAVDPKSYTLVNGIKCLNGGGIVAIIYTKTSQKTKDYQKLIYDELIKETGLKGNRSTPLATANLHVCRETNMPAVLVECGFMDSISDTKIILTEEFADECAKALVNSLVKIGNLTKKKVETPKEDTSGKIYRVQVGAYSVKANAEAMAKKLKADGYDAVIV